VFARLRERLCTERERDALILSRFHGRRTFVAPLKREKKGDLVDERISFCVVEQKNIIKNT